MKIFTRRPSLLSLTCILGLYASIAFCQDIPDSTMILLHNGTIIDGVTTEPYAGSLLLEQGKIKAVYKGEFTVPEGVQIVNCTGKYILPGLIDIHVHFATYPSSTDKPEIVKAKLNYFLKSGITTVRDMAGDTRYLAFLSRQALLGEIPSPDIYYAALMAGPDFFKDERTQSSASGAVPGQTPWMKAITPESNVTLDIAQAIGTGATGIKIYADLHADEVKRIVESAVNQNIQVWSHACVFPARPSDIIDAGVNVISHAGLLLWEGVKNIPESAKTRYKVMSQIEVENSVFGDLMDKIVTRDIILDATLATFKNERFDQRIFLKSVELTKLALNKGVKIGIGTDIDFENISGPVPLISEMKVMVEEVGMDRMQVIQAATRINAESIGIESICGTLTDGKLANVLILNLNPLTKLDHLSDIYMVFKKGKRVKPIIGDR